MISSNLLTSSLCMAKRAPMNFAHCFSPLFFTKTDDTDSNIMHFKISLFGQSRLITVICDPNNTLPEVFFDNDNLVSYNIPDSLIEEKVLNVTDPNMFVQLVVENVFHDILLSIFGQESKLVRDCMTLIKSQSMNGFMQKREKLEISVSYTDPNSFYGANFSISSESGTLRIKPPMHIPDCPIFTKTFSYQDIEIRGLFDISSEYTAFVEENKSSYFLEAFSSRMKRLHFIQIDKAEKDETPWFVKIWKNCWVYAKVVFNKPDASTTLFLKRADSDHENSFIVEKPADLYSILDKFTTFNG